MIFKLTIHVPRVVVCLPACCVLQLSLLTNLWSLVMKNVEYGATSLGALTSLKQLSRLHLSYLTALPSCLGQLTQLEQLELEKAVLPEQEVALLESALQRLHGLTCLVVTADGLLRWPQAVAQLGNLRRLMVWTEDATFGVPPAVDHRLPPAGPWLASLQWLGLDWPAALQSVAVLAAAQRLEYLCVVDAVGHMASPALADAEGWAAFWRWAGTHPSLKCLGFECYDERR